MCHAKPLVQSRAVGLFATFSNTLHTGLPSESRVRALRYTVHTLRVPYLRAAAKTLINFRQILKSHIKKIYAQFLINHLFMMLRQM